MWTRFFPALVPGMLIDRGAVSKNHRSPEDLQTPEMKMKNEN
jgi:hypothetical protein